MKNYIKKLIAWKASHEAALRAEMCILGLREIDAQEGKDVAAEIAKSKAQAEKRKAYIEQIKGEILDAKKKMAA